jgi:hypothetical protein
MSSIQNSRSDHAHKNGSAEAHPIWRPHVTPRIHKSEQGSFPPRLKFVNYSKDRRIMARCED